MTELSYSRPLHLTLEGDRRYPIYFDRLEDVPRHMEEAGLRQGRCLVVTDEMVAPLYASRLSGALTDAGWTVREVVLPAGETTKSYGPLHALYDAALGWGIDRKTPVLALGGGVIGDLAGFAAATLLRGLPLVQIPTTLIAQVDSAIGGKTGINHPAGKNLIGAFHQPALICADHSTLLTLPHREWTSGLAEVVKHGLIADAALYAFLEANWTAVLERDPTLLDELVYRAARVKVEVVGQDEREAGLRAILNFGHTFGHAIERKAGYGTFTHGEAVALGMRAALYLSALYTPDLPVQRIDILLRQLPVGGRMGDYPIPDLIDAMRGDKKAEAGTLRFVLLRRIGEAYVTDRPTLEEIAEAWEFIS
ncbi:MAG TPA: 3-dehydroquinate synthase [Rhodothermales bacterium]|nr:3-dehydroquinate synthase [Rhodothermales bacterium]